MEQRQLVPARDNRALLLKLSVVACAMFAFAWGLIPVYDALCKVTGLNKLLVPDSVAAAPASSRSQAAPLTLTFDATVQPGLPWEVRPLVSSLQARPGEFVRVDYEITNASNRHVVGQAIPRYLPAAAAEYVKKLDCFCFAQQAFEPGQTKRFPVVFVVDKSIPAGIDSITLAYTIFDVPGRS
ncbi:cytochrome c oxidase assembly protein [Vogesella sp. LIG4]|uniref:cytochrome c oxidase assembly protein n=1 Tax=Vogesella sp. LIG4 TaxID=1192162 RepID=UPI00081FBC6C|nr:cytochrome c oxidase assembly protein [Vogesella sp. LIG4]SCK13894.1 cytochrome c oxidase assembly protein subunit 11 [Vogesella sp. LIG4]